MEGKVLTRALLRLGALANLLLAAVHLLALGRLAEAFRLYGIEAPMARLAAISPVLPAAATIGVAAGFALCGLYGLSAAGTVRPLPRRRAVVAAVGALFLLRAAAGVVGMLRSGTWPPAEWSAALAAALIGGCYLQGANTYM